MIRKSIVALGAGLALFTQPLAAQEEDSADEAFAAFAQMFAAEPLTTEQEARLPLAQTIVGKMIPEGTLGEMMGGMFDSIFEPIMEMATSNPKGDVAKMLGVESYELDVTEEQAVELAAILDPVWKERNSLMASTMPAIMKDMMQVMEPPMRRAMSEAYAVYFTEQELADIDAFFSTDSGLAFARKSFTMSSDPRIIGASMEAMPAMMESFGDLESRMEEATAALPAKRGFSDLSDAERARIAEITGASVDEIQESMEFAAMMASSVDDAAEVGEESEEVTE